MFRQTIWLVACATFAGSVACQAAASNLHRVAPRGETDVAARLDGLNVSANLLTHEVAIGTASEQPPKRRTTNCTYSHIPCSLLDSLEISVGGRQMIVPRSAFGDLSDISSAELHVKPKGRFGLTLKGGDASESYGVEIVFDRHRVLERIVIDSEAQMVTQRTTYFDTPSSSR